MIAPIYFSLKSSKPKVASNRWWSYIPLFWWHALRETTEEVKLTVTLDVHSLNKVDGVNGSINDDKNNQKKSLTVKSNASVTFELPLVNLNDEDQFFTPDNGLNSKVGFLAGFPKPEDIEKSNYAGTGLLRIKIIEEDTSKTKELITKFGKLVKDNSGKIIESL